jgi:hypothetical protein
MHFIVSWDIKASEPLWTQIDNEMKGQLVNFPSLRPLTTFYVVKAQSQADWDNILRGLQTVASRYSGVYFVMSPLMQGGSYNGWLPSDYWPQLTTLTQ